MNLNECRITQPEGWFILPEDVDFSRCFFVQIPLASVGRHKLTGELHGSLMTNFADPLWAHDYELVWLHPSVKV